MSARDEAITFMLNEEAADTMDDDVAGCGQLLDAVPADVLARLAIERGAFKLYFWPADVKPASTNIRLYRLVEP
jgi:hypothetical protein